MFHPDKIQIRQGVIQGEPEELCDKISWLLNDRELHKTMSARAVEYAQDYAWEKIAKQIVDVYDGLVKKEE